MATKMKGFFKGFKYISQIFVYKEHEIEIGYPTDVKHLAHIGWDGSSVNAPSWMHEYKTSSDFSSTSLSNLVQSGDSSSVAMASWSSQDFSHSGGLEPLTEMFEGPRDLPKVPKKSKRKKSKSSSSKSKSSFSLDGAEAWEVRS